MIALRILSRSLRERKVHVTLNNVYLFKGGLMLTRITTTFFFLLGVMPANPAVAVPAYSKDAGAAYRALPKAKKGGTVYMRQLGNPKVLVPLINHDVDYKNVLGNLFARLYIADYDTNQFYPYLAEKLDVTPDRKVLTYTLRKTATWDDGTPVTADDVEFTFNLLMNKSVDAAPLRSYFEGMTFEKVDQYTFKFKVPNPNVNTINTLNADFMIVQKKQFEGQDFNNAKGIMQPVTNGPYRVKSYSRDQKLELERKKDWWGYQIKEFKNQFNFDSIVYRIIADSALAYEKLVKGDIDVLEMNSETFGTKVKGADKDKFGSSPESGKALWAKHFYTKAPAQWTYVGWNMKLPIFQSKKTRQALAHLIPYEEFISKVYFDQGIRSASPFGTQTPNTAPDQIKRAFKYDIAKGIKLLKADGWSDMDQTNTLSKMIDGKKTKFEFSLQYNSENPMRAKLAQIVKENFKKAGIIVNVQAIEYNALLDRIDNRDIEAFIMGWGKGSIYADSKQIWHTSSYENRGSNFVGYSNPEVDKLIEQASKELNIEKFYKLNHKIAAMIYDDQPYAFVVEVPGFMAGFNAHRLKSKRWNMKFDDTPAVWMYSAE